MSHPIRNGYHKENKVMKNTNRDEMKKESIYTVVENVSSPDWKLVTFFYHSGKIPYRSNFKGRKIYSASWFGGYSLPCQGKHGTESSLKLWWWMHETPDCVLETVRKQRAWFSSGMELQTLMPVSSLHSSLLPSAFQTVPPVSDQMFKHVSVRNLSLQTSIF